MIQLVKQALQADTDAFLELMERNSAAMYKVAWAILKNNEDVADAVQDTILTCFEKLHTLRKPEYFKTWMIRILLNHCYQIRNHYQSLNMDEEVPDISVCDNSLAELEFKEMLRSLEEKYRVVLVLYYAEGLKIPEIAGLLEINENTVKTRLSRAREQVKKLYLDGKPSAGGKTEDSVSGNRKMRDQGGSFYEKQDLFHNLDTQDDERIKLTLQREFPLPENVEAAKQNAFEKIRSGQCRREQLHQEETADGSPQWEGKSLFHRKRGRKKVYFRSLAGAAAAAVFSVICIANPALAEKISLVVHVFGELRQSLGFSGDFEKYAVPLTEASEEADGVEDIQIMEGDDIDQESEAVYSVTKNGMTVTLSEVYCNDEALYLSMIVETEEKFPDTQQFRQSDITLLNIVNSTLKFDYSDRENLAMTQLEGKLLDNHTYLGVLRYNMAESSDVTDYDAYYEARKEFVLQQGISEAEYDNHSEEALNQLCEKLGISREDFSDQAIIQAGGPDIEKYRASVEIPEKFTVELRIPQIIGIRPDGENPEMPEDIRAEYESAMSENGLGLTDEDYRNFTEEQKDIEHQLFTKMWNEYARRYPETQEWFNLGLKTVTKPPFELVVVDSGNIDCFTVVLDADGEPLDTGNTGGNTNTLSVRDRDVSKVDVYICDYMEYMDEIKGYYFSPDYEEKKKTKTYRQVLEERALYYKEIVFE